MIVKEMNFEHKTINISQVLPSPLPIDPMLALVNSFPTVSRAQDTQTQTGMPLK